MNQPTFYHFRKLEGDPRNYRRYVAYLRRRAAYQADRARGAMPRTRNSVVKEHRLT